MQFPAVRKRGTRTPRSPVNKGTLMGNRSDKLSELAFRLPDFAVASKTLSSRYIRML